MTTSTLPQQDDTCRDLTLAVIIASDHTITMRQIIELVRAGGKFGPAKIRAMVEDLIDDELVDFEQIGGILSRAYYHARRPPRMRATIIPAASVPLLGMAPRTWFSQLGASV